MKYKITDLMDLYEDKACPLKPVERHTQKSNEINEIFEVKQTKHVFGWKEGLSIAAAVMFFVVGSFCVKRFFDGPASFPTGTDNYSASSAPTGELPIGDHQSVHTASPTDADPKNPQDVSALSIGDGWTRLPAPEIAEDDAPQNSRDLDSVTALPVYSAGMTYTRDPAAGGSPCFYNEDQLQAILADSARRLHANLSKNPSTLRDGDGDLVVFGLGAQTDIGTLTVHGDGKVLIHFDQNHCLRGSSIRELSMLIAAEYGMTVNQIRFYDPDSAERPLTNAYVGCAIVPFSAEDMDPVFPAFGTVRLLTTDGTDVCGMYWYQRPGATGWDDCDLEWRKYEGEYPILSVKEAQDLVLSGACLTTQSGSLNLTADDLGSVELVYPTEDYHGFILPYYRFRIMPFQQDQSESASSAFVCVPAVRPDYLADWPES